MPLLAPLASDSVPALADAARVALACIPGRLRLRRSPARPVCPRPTCCAAREKICPRSRTSCAPAPPPASDAARGMPSPTPILPGCSRVSSPR
ncbi:MAG: hypothetical protein U1G05_07580 [Kiritimatiellia bacterium]